ncbi:IS3 family transposase [Streptomyces sp. YIM B13518]|uniref:IS3 family transposase n=1 Tax=Streptomyces sp. YIM B13518 TaxID=3366316 RepID=UPI0036BBFCE2
MHIASRPTCEAPRIHVELCRLNRRVNRERVARVMRAHDIRGVVRRKRRPLPRPDAKAKAQPAPDLIGRDLHADRPGTKPVGDNTHLPTAGAGSTSPAGWTWPPARQSAVPWPAATAPSSSSRPSRRCHTLRCELGTVGSCADEGSSASTCGPGASAAGRTRCVKGARAP